MQEQMDNISQYIDETLIKNQKEIPETKNRNEKCFWRTQHFDTADERSNEHEDRSIETSQPEMQTRNWMPKQTKTPKQNIQDLWDNFKCVTCELGIPKENNEAEDVFDVIMAEKLSKINFSHQTTNPGSSEHWAG